MSWLSETLFNLKNMTAIKGMLFNIKEDLGRWLLYELSPSFYVTGFQWSGLFTEMVGWTKHIGIGAGAMVAWLILSTWVKLPKWLGIVVMGIIAFIVEIIQFLIAKASFINPINSILDILFYMLGAGILLYGWEFAKNKFNS